MMPLGADRTLARAARHAVLEVDRVRLIRPRPADVGRPEQGDDRHAQRFTPRRKGSTWSALNVEKIRQLEAAGRMTDAGRAAFAQRTEERTGRYSYEQRVAARFTDEETARFEAVAEAWDDWQRRPPSYRRAVTFWVTSAKRPETRVRRLQQLIDASAARQPVGPMRRASDR